MAAPTVIPTETPIFDADSLVAQDAADALIALGWPVVPAGDDMDRWAVGDFEMTDAELIGLATRWGIQAAAERVQ